MSTPELSSVAVLGLGAMGASMARRLAESGVSVGVWNRDARRTADAAHDRVTPFATPAAAVATASLVFTVVTNDSAVEEVLFDKGAAAAMSAGATLIQVATIDPVATLRIAERLPPHLRMLDAPVLGSVDAVLSGSLTVLVGGENRVLDECQPVLDLLGTVLQTGGIGTGSAAKLVANASLLGALTLLGEIVALADVLGLERGATLDVLRATPLASQVDRRADALAGNIGPRRFALAHALKDAGLAVNAAHAHSLGPRLLPAVLSWLTDAAAKDNEADYTAVLPAIVGSRRTGNTSKRGEGD